MEGMRREFACNVFAYLDDLTKVFAASRQSLKKNGIFAFSTEYLEAECTQPFELQKSARFAHKHSYIESLASSYNYRIVQSQKSLLRKNAGADVDGLLFVMTKV
ncbi:methyltransferase [Fragilaria crotonensis]|nr:methyltransferase [Fragilaria crotonensis]